MNSAAHTHRPGDPDSSAWLVRFDRRPAAELRLFCFAHAGSGPGVYRPWAAAMPPSIEVIGVALPGRERRLAEPPMTSLPVLLESLVQTIAPFRERPFAFFGHSMGATLAFELSRALATEARTGPVRLLLSGRRAPHLVDDEPPVHPLEDKALLDEVQRRYGGIPPEVFDYPMLVEAILPALRADMTLLETMPRIAEGHEAPLDVPISAFGGHDDPRVTRAALEAWQHHTRLPVTVRLLPGGHFYLNEPASRQVLIQNVVADLLRDLQGAPWRR